MRRDFVRRIPLAADEFEGDGAVLFLLDRDVVSAGPGDFLADSVEDGEAFRDDCSESSNFREPEKDTGV